jgi:hypothetical protein
METMWRCACCRKWSHAQRRPPWHQRFVDVEPTDPALILRFDQGVYDHMNGWLQPSGWWIKCGPFDRWTAVQDFELSSIRPVAEGYRQ